MREAVGGCWKKFGRGPEVSSYTTVARDSKGRAGQFERRGGGARATTWGKRLSPPSGRVNASNLLGLPANAPTKL